MEQVVVNRVTGQGLITKVAKVNGAGQPQASCKREGPWRSEAAYVGSKVLRLLLGSDGNFQGSYLEGTVSGWLPAAEADYISPLSAEPAGLWRVRYEKVESCRRPFHFADVSSLVRGSFRGNVDFLKCARIFLGPPQVCFEDKEEAYNDEEDLEEEEVHLTILHSVPVQLWRGQKAEVTKVT